MVAGGSLFDSVGPGARCGPDSSPSSPLLPLISLPSTLFLPLPSSPEHILCAELLGALLMALRNT